MKTQWWGRLGVVLALALGTYCALTPATAQQADIDAIYKRFDEFYAAGDYAAALVEAHKLEALVKVQLGVNHRSYAAALNNLAVVQQDQGKYDEAADLHQRALAIREKALGPDHPDVADSLNNLAVVQQYQGKYGEAAGFYQRALAIREKALGPDHPDVAATFNNLAIVYALQGKYGEAAGLFQRALAIKQNALGSNHPDVARTLNNLANMYQSQGKYGEAAELYQRALAISEKALGPSHPDVARALNNLANVYALQGKYGEAAGLYQRALALEEKALGPSHPDVAKTLTLLALVDQAQGKYPEAADLHRRALAIRENAFGPDHPSVGDSLKNLADMSGLLGKDTEVATGFYLRSLKIKEKTLGSSHPQVAEILTNLAANYESQGKYAEATDLSQRSVAILEKALGPTHPHLSPALTTLANQLSIQGRYSDSAALHLRALAIDEKTLGSSNLAVAASLENLSSVYRNQFRYSDAAELAQRALAIKQNALGSNHPDLAPTLNKLALVFSLQGKYAEAVNLHQRALAIAEKTLRSNHPHVLANLTNLADVYRKQGKYAEATDLLQRALAIEEKALGASHPDVAKSLDGLAITYTSQGKHGEAAELLQRALAIEEKALGASHPDVAQTFHHLAIVCRSAGKPDLALSFSREATAAVIAHAVAGDTASRRPDNAHGLVEQRTDYFVFHVANLAGAARAGLGPMATLGHEGFEIAQWAAQSSAGAAVQQMALRFAAGDNALAALVRDNQDLAAAWRGQDKALIAALAKPEGQQDRATIEALRAAMAESESKLAANAARLDKEFPDYAALANPKPLSVEEAQKLLGGDEALLFVLPGDNESYVFALTRDAFDWKTIPLGAAALSDKVDAFRKGLDVNKLESFDLNLAQELHAALLAPVEAHIKDKRHLLVAASGSLTALPFHLLVTEKPASAAPNRDRRAAYRNAAWLVKHHAVSVLPAVTSLKALRLFARKDQGAKPMIGFGNPVFDPNQTPAPAAAAKQRGAAKSRIKTASRAMRAYSDVWSGAGVDRDALIADLKNKALPETADELKAVRLALGAPANDIHLGKDASETTVKRAPLADYRIVYFATHAAAAGQVKGLGEPSIVLTVPKQPTEIDDGLLTASEAAQLKLNADWVVLAACNTDAGDKEGAEALSGLARAFFYAGARALLVSHWEVDSDAAAALNISTFDILKADPSLGRAEAVRRAMLAYMNEASKPTNVYPALWGAFSVVGEGAAR